MTTPVIAPPAIDPRIARRDWPLARAVRHVLESHYPEWAWGVEIPQGQNVVIVRNLDCDPKGKYGMVLHRDKLDPALRQVVLAGGEFLERFRMRRAGYRPEETNGRVLVLERPET